MTSIKATTVTNLWFRVLRELLEQGDYAEPRGMPTREILGLNASFSMNYPVLNCPLRRLSYRFLTAEALWILSGSDKVDEIAPYCPAVAKFSDDGVRFFGAYGPRFRVQLDHVIRSLCDDRDSRQAVVTLWRQNPPRTKDVPCTVALAWQVRQSQLHCHVWMRSSDAWLGLPYDLFNFTMMTCMVCHRLNSVADYAPVLPGTLYWTAASSHLYEKDEPRARECLQEMHMPEPCQSLPVYLLDEVGGMGILAEALRRCRDGEDPDGLWPVRPVGSLGGLNQ